MIRKAGLRFLCAATLLVSTAVGATPQWYRGVLTRVAFFGPNDFIIMFDNELMSDCKWNYVYFRESVMGRDLVRNAYSMAITALASGRQMGVVVDKAINGPGGECRQEGNNMFDIQ